jgi:Domain of unknown function (DUF397)
MDEIRNGVPAVLLDGATWRKSSYSGAVGNCVELALLRDGTVAVRNSRHPAGPALIHDRAGLAALVGSAKRW